MLLVLLIYNIRFYVSFYSFDRSLSLTYPISFIHAFIHSTEQNTQTHAHQKCHKLNTIRQKNEENKPISSGHWKRSHLIVEKLDLCDCLWTWYALQ